MPKRQDIKSVMIISSGPIVIGQGCEFDYSGTQACKALREEGIRIVLLNSNPATIMTDPEMADRIYIEPITPEAIDKILQLERERGTPVDALLPTLGGQTGLNCAVTAADKGILDKHKVQLIGANQQAIHKAEDRTEFKKAMIKIGLDVPQSGIAHSWAESQEVLKEVGLPVAIRPAYTLGGTGGGFAYTMEEFEKIAKRGLEYSLNNEILIEESCLGWKEYELEVMRDRADNVVIICSIENFDPMGVHTGDSITVAPAQTLTDKEYQLMRDAAIRIIREIGVETGGSNIQFAVHPDTGRMIVIEMNPRVSRSSALASKATGYPIARIAAKLALGYTLDELPNDITKKTPASFEPTIDYCVVKIPRWTFEKFPEADETLTTQMKSVGEAMAIGRTFKEALQKGIRSMEIKRFGLGLDSNDKWLKSVRDGTGTMSVPSRGTAFQAVGHGDSQEDHGQDARATDAHAADASGTAFQTVDREGIEDGDDAFVPFNPHDLSIRYSAYLPHWEQEGATYAVTFRLADSLPRKVLERWQHEREEIVRGAEASQRDLSATEQQRLSKLHSDRVEKYLDAGHGSCHLKDERAAEIVRDAMLHFDGQRYDLIAWCVMPNHVHVVVRPRPGYELAKVISSWKSYTSNQVNEVLGRSGALWQPDAFDHLIRDAEDLERSVQYVLDNPRAAGLGAWPWVGCGKTLGGKASAGATSRGTAFQAVGPEEEEDHGQDARATDTRAADASGTAFQAVRREEEEEDHGQDARATDAHAMSSGTPTRAVPPIVGTRASEAPADTKEESAKAYPIPLDVLNDKLGRPCQGRLYYIRYAFKMGWSVEQVFELSKIDPWFLENIKELVEFEDELLEQAATNHATRPSVLEQWAQEYDRGAEDGDLELLADHVPNRGIESELRLLETLRTARQWGYSEVQLASVFQLPRDMIRKVLRGLRLAPVYKLVDTCAAEFEAYTPYYYSSHENAPMWIPMDFLKAAESTTGLDPAVLAAARKGESAPDDEIRVSEKQKVIVLGGGPNRIGQGIEFDYCCVHAVFTARDQGYETVMVNSNPETVSTDYDTSDLLFFEPLTHEDVLNICERLNGQPFGEVSNAGLLKGVIVQFGGQTPLNLAEGLKAAGVPILGTSPESIDMAEDRDAFQRIINELGLRQPTNGIAYDLKGAIKIAAEIGYPVLVRPSYVLGGRAMEKCHLEQDLVRYMVHALKATDRAASVEKEHPILIDQFLSEAIEVDVDCISDGKRTVVCGVMEHIEEAGIHSGDSACALPPYSLSPAIVDEIKRQSALLAERLNVCGLMNVQYAVKDDLVYVIEVNPRASRTVPFVSKATGVPWAKLATKVMLGQSLDEVMAEHGIEDAPWPKHISVKEAVFPFTKFPGIDCVLGPEMRSTGEVMGVDKSFALAYAKSQMAAGVALPTSGTVLISVNDHDKPLIVPIAADFEKMGFRIVSTLRTREVLVEAGIEADLVSKIQDPAGPYLIDMINDGQIDLLINTPIYWGSAAVESRIRSAAVMHNLPLITTMPAARAAVQAIAALREGAWDVRAIQDYHSG